MPALIATSSHLNTAALIGLMMGFYLGWLLCALVTRFKRSEPHVVCSEDYAEPDETQSPPAPSVPIPTGQIEIRGAVIDQKTMRICAVVLMQAPHVRGTLLVVRTGEGCAFHERDGDDGASLFKVHIPRAEGTDAPD